ncbi:glycoside hydrolase family 16 protein, partial [Rhizobium ruizarguesonis]
MRYGISSKALGLLIVLGLGALPGQPSVAHQPLNINAYQLTFEESFDSLDFSAWGERSSRWIAHTPWNV